MGPGEGTTSKNLDLHLKGSESKRPKQKNIKDSRSQNTLWLLYPAPHTAAELI
jgi:hypothetical protein